MLAAAVLLYTYGSFTTGGGGGVQIGDGLLTVEECVALVASSKLTEIELVLPCECRDYDPEPYSCHPNCCPLERCHQNNQNEWSVYEQVVCRPPTRLENFPGDGVCLYNGGNPAQVVASQPNGVSGDTRISFSLSQRPEHACEDLILSECIDDLLIPAVTDFRFLTPEGVGCWQNCPVEPISACGKDSCPHRRGRTHKYVRHWDVPTLTPGITYMLSCVTTASSSSDLVSVNQTQYLPSAFTVPP